MYNKKEKCTAEKCLNASLKMLNIAFEMLYILIKNLKQLA